MIEVAPTETQTSRRLDREAWSRSRARPTPGCGACEALEAELIREHSRAGSWRSLHGRAVEREQGLARELEAQRLQAAEREQAIRQELDAVKARLHARERELFAKRSERSKGKKTSEGVPNGGAGVKRHRGQQRGAVGHGRRRHEHLPSTPELRDLDETDKVCSACGEPLVPEGGAEISEIIEVEVKAHRRIIKRLRHRRTCTCPGLPKLVVAPPAPKLIPKGAYGVSFWVLVLLEKFCFQRPLHRALSALRLANGLDVSRGTVTDGLARLSPLFEPLYAGLVAESVDSSVSHWHADETRWFVYIDGPDGSGYRTWYLWVFISARAVVFQAEPSRSAAVPLKYFGELSCGILSADRYAAYKVLLNDRLLILAFCWAHVRRDFLGVAKDWQQLHRAWGQEWVARIGELYEHNDRRLALRGDQVAFRSAHRELEAAVARMAERRDAELADANLHPARRKVLTSLANHWSGLVVFVEHPDVPMDNNAAEREIREEVIGRRNYHGSGAPWSARLAAMLFSLFRTLQLWQIDVRKWLTSYLDACANNGGRPPPEPTAFLPWNMTQPELERLRAPAPATKSNTS